MFSSLLAIDLLLISAGLWLAAGLSGLAFPRNTRFVAKVIFPLGALVGLGVGVTALGFLGQSAETAILVIGLPTLPFHLRLDNLTAVFALLLGFASVGISIYAAGYFRKGEGTAPGLMCLQYHAFLASMLMVLLADDAYAFMVAWEAMALSSFFLVTTDHRHEAIRRAGYLYLLIAHIGAIAILLAFGVMTSGSGDYTFAGMRAQELSPFWASAAFLLALAGFGAKAGLVPLHVWLPEAHPAAPSPVSAMMSGVMLKTAIYGLLRVSFDLLGTPLSGVQWWWGVVAMAIGLITALFGVLYSTVQSDMKRLLAYSSIENIGLLAVGIGLTLIFHAFHMETLAALSMTAVLYHCLAHAGFKSLLFLCTGSVLHATQERSLGKLGGLIHRMPWVAWLALVGVIAGAGLPPLSGFVSEWLLLQAFLFSPGLPHSWLNMVVPVAAALVVLVAALAGFAMVKFHGIIFLGQMREPNLKDAHDAGPWERGGLSWLTLLTLLLGVLPSTVIGYLDAATTQLLGTGLAARVRDSGWWMLAPISEDRASYQPLIFLATIVASVLLGRWLVRRLYHGRVRRSQAWDCGFFFEGPRAQDTAEGFSQPIRRIFEPVFRMSRHFPTARDEKPYCSVKVEDHFWHWLYLPVARAVEFLSGLVVRVQGGRIAVYLMYSFLTLIVLLLVARP